MRRILLAVVAAVLVLLGVMVARTLALESHQLTAPAAEPLAFDLAAAAEHLGAAIRLRTVSHQDGVGDDVAAVDALHAHLEASYPLLHAALPREKVAGASLLYVWKGSNPSLPPLLLAAHQDVVPVEEDAERHWTHPPFGGRVVDGAVWGRGAMDDKSGLISVMEAVEALLAAGFQPVRTVLLAFGHDEEVLGKGAPAMAALLEARGVRPFLVMDEGLIITDGIMPGTSRPIAMLGIAQKGYLTVELAVAGTGGHSSMPPAETAAAILGAAVARLEAHQMPPRSGGVAQSMFDFVGTEMSFPLRLAFANLWLTRPALHRVLLRKPSTAAVIRTTTAPTMLEASPKENVLPTRARARVNFRLAPGDTVDGVLEHVADAVADDRVHVTPQPGGYASPPPTNPDGAPFRLVHRALARVTPEVAVAPGLVVGATDSRHYARLAPDMVLFRPMQMNQEDTRRVHGRDERLPLTDLGRMVRFYAQVIRDASVTP
ncbi:MAG: M20 family peptidase [Deltaproteobacteria bacterium]|nr:M20 family peptidase [Deltaproteobacteria bacterium]